MGSYGLRSLGSVQDSAMTNALRFCCQVPEIPRAGARFGWLSTHTRYNPRLMERPRLNLLLASLLVSSSVHAIDAIEFEARELTVAGVPMSGVQVRLDLVSDTST